MSQANDIPVGSHVPAGAKRAPARAGGGEIPINGALWLRLRSGKDAAIRERLILSHVHLVRLFARPFQATAPSWLEPEDLLGAGNRGLIHAVDHYQPARGKFARYARACIEGAIREAIRSTAWGPRSAGIDCVPDSDNDLGVAVACDPLAILLDREQWSGLARAIACLPDARAAVIIERHLMENVPMEQVACSIGVSEKRAYQLQALALRSLRRHVE